MTERIPGQCCKCGCGLQSTTAFWCVACFRKNMMLCPHCVRNGKVRKEYQTHTKRHSRIVEGKLCPVCKGERFVARQPI